MKVLVTCPPMLGLREQFLPIFEQHGIEVGMPDFVQTLSEQELIEILPEYDGWIIGDDPATAQVLEAGAAGQLKAAVKWGIGVDNVDFDACKRLGIPITNTPNMFGREVADIALGYVIGLARETFAIDRSVRSGNWLKVSGMSLAGKKVGLIGYGDIGRNTAKRLLAADMHVTAYDPFFDQSQNPFPEVVFQEWPNALSDLDFIVFTCALTESNYHMFSKAQIDKCKTGVRVVNVARGPLINEADLVEALVARKIKSAALDVFENEPLDINSKLAKMEHCIFGSHNSSNTIDAVHATNIKAIDELLGFLGVQ
ncbi:phosphoglycerate dehydrogenase [Marinibactrum halimedae]|uniref:Phosphoglycerate dehydrogenase n=1 Tax=Marinibactrum halimedae TaxID=1444977 RepID=A0AA37TD02_9GAMM|nr:phosphoglycerate dehydrogenase [Marinibactrum halimedae]MCD9459839.1 phosphoglycerate dehydrogenase [Marinibactrum halimedae]GLS26967.1 phosphoglycerate dehydrogenase [Marinibactrum halimedae]